MGAECERKGTHVSNKTISIPDMGGAENVEVVEVMVSAGDDIQLDDVLIVLESDKASMEIPSPHAGKLLSVDVKTGDTVSEGDVFAHIEAAGAEPATVEEAPAGQSVDTTTGASPEPVEAPVEAEPEAGPGLAAVSAVDVQVPELGGAEDVEVIELVVKAGDELLAGDTMLVLESDKASMEVPAPRAGRVTEVYLQLGDKVGEGANILGLLPADGELAPTQGTDAAKREVDADVAVQPPAVAKPDAEKPGGVTVPESAVQRSAATLHAGPAVRKLAREFGVDLTAIHGSGAHGRILKDDIQAYVAGRLAVPEPTSGPGIEPIPEVDFSRFGEIRVEPMSKVQKIIAANMHRSWLNVPRVSQFDEVDITALEKFRAGMKAGLADQGVKLTPLPFLLRACATALRKNPMLNASLHSDGEHLVYKEYVHIGLAVDTPAGLMVPVIRHVDRKSLLELATETAELAALAKARKLKPEQMQGACFTISSLGNIGGTGFTPIINPPELAILGVSRLAVKPIWNGKKFKPRKMLPLTLAYDHRAINGAIAGRFMQDIAAILADVRRLLL